MRLLSSAVGPSANYVRPAPQHRLGLFQIESVEALSEPAVDGVRGLGDFVAPDLTLSRWQVRACAY